MVSDEAEPIPFAVSPSNPPSAVIAPVNVFAVLGASAQTPPSDLITEAVPVRALVIMLLSVLSPLRVNACEELITFESTKGPLPEASIVAAAVTETGRVAVSPAPT